MYTDLLNQTFGELTVIEHLGTADSHGQYWNCKCSCGNQCIKTTRQLHDNQNLSCGCNHIKYKAHKNKINIGDKYGYLTIISYNPKSDNSNTNYWDCECICGKIVTIAQCNLKHRISCGCIDKHNDLTNKQFGMLKAIKPTIQRNSNNDIMWECICECGEKCLVSSHKLVTNHTKSCGCMISKNENYIASILKENNINFDRQHIFNDCLSPKGNNLKFDFYVDDKYVIEFDGKQHQDDIAWMESTDDLKQRDTIKTQYCFQHNIPIIRIPNVKLENITIQDLSLDSKYLLRSEERFED